MNKTFKKHKNGNFTIVDNNILKNRDMSLKAKGLLILMLSLPDDWEYSERGLVVLSKDGRDGVRSALRELENLNYLRRKTLRDENGQFISNQYNIYESPLNSGDTPWTEKPSSEKPILDNPPNKVLSNKELSNKKNMSSCNEHKEIVNYLNEVCGTKYRHTTKATQRHINARLNEGFTLDQFKQVIDIKASQWLDDPKMSIYLRPETLFGTKFESYLNEPKPHKEKEIKKYGNFI